MSFAIQKRLEKLEAAIGKKVVERAVHRLLVPEGQDSQARIDRMIADGLAAADDLFIVRNIITGVPRSEGWAA